MSKVFKQIRAENQDYVKNMLEQKGFKVRIFPLRERGLNQSNFRKVEIVNPGQGLENMRRSRSLREIDFLRL